MPDNIFGLLGTNTAGQSALFPDLNQTPEFKKPKWQVEMEVADKMIKALGLEGQEAKDAKLGLFTPDVLNHAGKAAQDDARIAAGQAEIRERAEDADGQVGLVALRYPP